MVVVSHELASILAIGHRAILLDKKRIVAEGEPKKLKAESDNPVVKKFFNRKPGR
jgi:phospholipid/cholesterol/gamma-HCH transport system ATP-binding protein